MTEISMSIIDFIPYDHYVSRQELVDKTGLPDREVRRRINLLRKNPETVVISSSHNKGYKRPRTYAEIERCLNESIARMNEEIEKQKTLRVLLNNRDQRGLGI